MRYRPPTRRSVWIARKPASVPNGYRCGHDTLRHLELLALALERFGGVGTSTVLVCDPLSNPHRLVAVLERTDLHTRQIVGDVVEMLWEPGEEVRKFVLGTCRRIQRI
eukprot:3472608-Rhodomonas_salina.2